MASNERVQGFGTPVAATGYSAAAIGSGKDGGGKAKNSAEAALAALTNKETEPVAPEGVVVPDESMFRLPRRTDRMTPEQLALNDWREHVETWIESFCPVFEGRKEGSISDELADTLYAFLLSSVVNHRCAVKTEYDYFHVFLLPSDAQHPRKLRFCRADNCRVRYLTRGNGSASSHSKSHAKTHKKNALEFPVPPLLPQPSAPAPLPYFDDICRTGSVPANAVIPDPPPASSKPGKRGSSGSRKGSSNKKSGSCDPGCNEKVSVIREGTSIRLLAHHHQHDDRPSGGGKSVSGAIGSGSRSHPYGKGEGTLYPNLVADGATGVAIEGLVGLARMGQQDVVMTDAGRGGPPRTDVLLGHGGANAGGGGGVIGGGGGGSGGAIGSGDLDTPMHLAPSMMPRKGGGAMAPPSSDSRFAFPATSSTGEIIGSTVSVTGSGLTPILADLEKADAEQGTNVMGQVLSNLSQRAVSTARKEQQIKRESGTTNGSSSSGGGGGRGSKTRKAPPKTVIPNPTTNDLFADITFTPKGFTPKGVTPKPDALPPSNDFIVAAGLTPTGTVAPISNRSKPTFSFGLIGEDGSDDSVRIVGSAGAEGMIIPENTAVTIKVVNTADVDISLVIHEYFPETESNPLYGGKRCVYPRDDANPTFTPMDAYTLKPGETFWLHKAHAGPQYKLNHYTQVDYVEDHEMWLYYIFYGEATFEAEMVSYRVTKRASSS